MSQPDYLVARLGDPISHGGCIIQGCRNTNTTPGDIRASYKGAMVVCALHLVQRIVGGALNTNVDVGGRDIKTAANGSPCSCGARCIALSDNSHVEGNAN